MISLEQIRLLEAKITKAVELIRTLKVENSNLRNTLDSAQSRMQDLEKLVGDLKTDQREIEASILRAMQNLDQLEDEVSEPAAKAAEEPAEEPPDKPERAIPQSDSASGEDEDNEDSDRELDIF